MCNGVKIEIDDGEKRVIFLVEYYQQLLFIGRTADYRIAVDAKGC
jgi:hypothetical protein